MKELEIIKSGCMTFPVVGDIEVVLDYAFPQTEILDKPKDEMQIMQFKS